MKNFVKIIALLLVACTVFSLCACGNGGKTDETTKAETTKTSKDTEKVKDDETTAEDTTAEDTTAEETTAEETTAADTTVAETTKPVQQTQQQVVTTTPSTNAPTPDLGKGSKSDPYLEIPTVGTSSMTLTTVSIPAGKTLFYNIYRVGGMVVTVNNPNAYIICNGTRYDAKNGVISFIAPNALASDSISFEIGNKGGAAAAFTLIFTNLSGTMANPQVLTSLNNGKITISLAEGDSDGYCYKYKAEKAGKIRFYLSATVTSILSVTNNRNSAQRNTDSDSQTDANGTYVEIEVNAGDELIITVGAIPNKRGKYPATSITWSGKYC